MDTYEGKNAKRNSKTRDYQPHHAVANKGSKNETERLQVIEVSLNKLTSASLKHVRSPSIHTASRWVCTNWSEVRRRRRESRNRSSERGSTLGPCRVIAKHGAAAAWGAFVIGSLIIDCIGIDSIGDTLVGCVVIHVVEFHAPFFKSQNILHLR